MEYFYNLTNDFAILLNKNKQYLNFRWILIILMTFGISLSGYAQKEKEIIPTLDCIKYTGNGLYQASFGYENPSKKEVVIDENGSIIKSNNGKRVAKGLNKFKGGTNTKVFTKEFSANDYVEWTIVTNGKEHTIVVNANGAKCAPDDGFIFPVIGNGKSYDLIGQELTAFCNNVVGENPSELIFQLDLSGDKVLVEIVPEATYMDEVILLLQASPFNVQSTDFLLPIAEYYNLSAVDVYLDKDKICFLNDYPNEINFARPVYPAYNSSGGVTSQGDAAQTSNLVRESFRFLNTDTGKIQPVDGTGVKIGVLSDSYDMAQGVPYYAALDVIDLELPDNVELIMDNAFKATDEGRAMMQIIHDVAPGAGLAFHTATASPRQFEVGFKALATEKCDLIVDDITFITEPFFGEGRISKAINDFATAGGMHFTSAGNIANKGYQSTFSASSNVPSTNFIDANSPTRAHLFDGSGDYLQKISVVPGTYLIALQWEESAASQENQFGATDDLDIYVVDDTGRLLVGNNRVNDFGDPTEVIVFKSTGTGEANILITSAKGATNVPFRYIAFRTTGDDPSLGGLKFEEYFGNGAPTVSGHAMNPAPGTVTVGAVDYRKMEFPVAETFSSYAGSLSDGTLLEIDMYAPDGGNTTSTTIGQDAQCDTCDKDGVLNFYGTSAAAPHAAAAMALLQSALPKWYPDGNGESTYSAQQALDLFEDTSTKFIALDGSQDGLINTNNAFKSIAAQTAKILSLTIESGIPSADSIVVKIIGDFLPSIDASPYPAQIWFDGKKLEFTVETDGSISATIPPFIGNPYLTIYTEPKVGSEGNGGYSDPVKVLPDGKIALNIIADNAEFEYGDDINLTSFKVEGLPLDEYGVPVSFESLGFATVVLNSTGADEYLNAGDYPIVFDYRITPSFSGVFDDADTDGVPDVYDQCPNDVGTAANNGCPDTDVDGVPDLYDQCPETPVDAVVDENGCSVAQKEVPGFTPAATSSPATTYQVNFISGYVDSDPEIGKRGYLTIIKKDLTITAEPEEYTYGDAMDLTLKYNFEDDNITNKTNFYDLINTTHTSDFKDGIPNKFRAVVSKFRAVVSDYDLTDLLNGGSWSASDKTINNKFRAVVSGMNIIDLDTQDFTNYIDSRENFDGEITNKFRAVVSKFRAVVSAEDLFSGDIELGIENKFRAVVSKFRAVVSEDNPDRPYSGYESVFAIIDADDATPDEDDPDFDPNVEYGISEMFALNMITGLEVTPLNESHNVYPGAFLNAMASNFNIIYEHGSLIVNPKNLTVSTENVEIPYGQELTKADLISTFEGWAFEDPYKESEATVFPDSIGGIPYYFVKVDDEDIEANRIERGDLEELGDYLIKIRDPQNYVITHVFDNTEGNTYSKLTITKATLTAETDNSEVFYGTGIKASDLTTVFSAFAHDELSSDVFPEGVPYYFVDSGFIRYELESKMPVGDYSIKIDNVDNYVFTPIVDDTHGTLEIKKAPLTVKTYAFEVEYGDSVSNEIVSEGKTEISGFAEGEGLGEEFDVFSDGIPYLFNGLDIDNVKELGNYTITVGAPVSGNYVIAYHENHGDLTITKATLTFDNQDQMITYGQTPSVEPDFEGFAEGEDLGEENDVFPDGIPYFFMKQGETPECDTCTKYYLPYGIGTVKMNVGKYDIFITDDLDNYKFYPDTKLGTLTINKATLTVTISPEKLIVNQGDTPALTTTFVDSDFAYEEAVIDVFPAGIPYYFEGEPGTFDDTSVPGVFTVRIEDPTNYEMAYNDVTLFVNPFNNDIKKVRTYADCVKYNDDGSDTYTVTYRYENDNDDAVFAALGADNNLSGQAAETATGDLPTIFMPGSGTFEIVFSGEQLVWSLTTYEGTHKSSVSSASTSGANECDAKLDTSYTLAPNPVTSDVDYYLTITNNIMEESDVYVYNMYGSLVITKSHHFDGTIGQEQKVDMFALPDGLYIVRIVSATNVRTYNIIKQ